MTFRPILLSALLVGLPALATAQSGTVRYSETTPLDFKPCWNVLSAAFATLASQLPESPAFDRASLTAVAPPEGDKSAGRGAGPAAMWREDEPETPPDHWWLDSPTAINKRSNH